MKRILYILSLLLLVVADVDAQQVDQAAVRAKINRTAMDMKSMECDFVQTKYMKMLNDKMVSKGHMCYQQKNKLRWEYTSPKKYLFVLNDTKVGIQSGNRNDVIDTNQNKVFKEIARIMMNSVVGKCLNDDKEYKVSITANATDWIATLIPQRKNMRQLFKKITIRFDKQRAVVSQVELLETNDDRTVIELKNVKTNHAISPNQFVVR